MRPLRYKSGLLNRFTNKDDFKGDLAIRQGISYSAGVLAQPKGPEVISMIHCWGNLLTDWYYPVDQIPTDWIHQLGIHHTNHEEFSQIHRLVLAHPDIDRNKAVNLMGGVPQNLYRLLSSRGVPTNLVGQSPEDWGSSLTLFCPYRPDQRVTWVVPPRPWDQKVLDQIRFTQASGRIQRFQENPNPSSKPVAPGKNWSFQDSRQSAVQIITIDGHCLPGLFKTLSEPTNGMEFSLFPSMKVGLGLLVLDLAADYLTNKYAREIIKLLETFIGFENPTELPKLQGTCVLVGTRDQLQSLNHPWTNQDSGLKGYLAIEKQSPRGATISWNPRGGFPQKLYGWDCEPVPVMEPTGIGDSFLAGLLHELDERGDYLMNNPEDWFQAPGFWDQARVRMQLYSHLACKSIGPWDGRRNPGELVNLPN